MAKKTDWLGDFPFYALVVGAAVNLVAAFGCLNDHEYYSAFDKLILASFCFITAVFVAISEEEAENGK